MSAYVIGLDYGTDSVRALIVDTKNGEEISSAVHEYTRWKEGKYCDAHANQFRQHPMDYLEGLENSIKEALASADAAKREMQNLTANNEKLLKEARVERDAMMKEARELKAKLIADAKEEAKSEGAKMIANAQAAIQSEKKAAIADIKNQVASLSIEIAEKVVTEELSNKDKQLKLVSDLLGDATLN